MTNKKRKGFTIVELVIVIAVIAILAGVLIPTFTSIIDKANQSSDIQAVRQMNVLLMAESVEDKPTDVNKVIEIVSKAGYDTAEKRTPKSSDHGFYWYEEANIILLAKDKEGETPVLVYPVDNDALKTALETGLSEENKFYNLKDHIGIGGNTGGNESENLGIVVSDEEELLDALETGLETGEEITLGNNITIKELITISGGTSEAPIVINLNNYTLTLDASASVVITGYVVFDGATESILSELSGETNSEDSGSATRYSKRSNSANLMECDNETLTSSIIINDDGAYYNGEEGIGTGTYYDDGPWGEWVVTSPGFKVKGSLTISNLAIDGKRYCNIDNEGTVILNDVDFEVTPATILYQGNKATALSHGIINRGKVSFENVNYKENYIEALDDIPSSRYAYAFGIRNYDTITLILNSSFNVIGGYGIHNAGPATINNTVFTVNGGRHTFDANTGFYNEYTSTSVEDTVTITGGSFIAAGTIRTSVRNYSGTMTISGSTFSESTDEGVEVSYSNYAPIVNDSSSQLTLTDVNVNINSSANYYVYTAGGEVTINGGIYGDTSTTGLFSCLDDGIVTINNGTTDDKKFSLNGKTFDDFFDLNSSPKTYLNNDNPVSTILISDGTTKTIMLNNGRDNLKVLAEKFENNTIPKGCVVTIYLDNETTDIDVDILVAGTLTLNGLGDGGISHLRNEGRSITLLEKGCLYFNSIGNYEYDPKITENNNNKDELIERCIYYVGEYTFKIDGTDYTLPSTNIKNN